MKLYRKEPCKCCRGTGRLTRLNGAEYRKRREAAGLGLREAAGRAGISPTHLSDVESGKRTASTELATALAQLVS